MMTAWSSRERVTALYLGQYYCLCRYYHLPCPCCHRRLYAARSGSGSGPGSGSGNARLVKGDYGDVEGGLAMWDGVCPRQMPPRENQTAVYIHSQVEATKAAKADDSSKQVKAGNTSKQAKADTNRQSHFTG
jgi:hypothetical protein